MTKFLLIYQPARVRSLVRKPLTAFAVFLAMMSLTTTHALAQWSAVPRLVGQLENARAGDFADFNGDGLADILAVAPETASLVVFLQQAGGEWEPSTISERLPGAIQVAIGDISGDGRADAVVTLRDEGIVGLIPPKNEKLPWVRVDMAGMLEVENPRETLVTDLDGDGDLDVVFLQDTDNDSGGIYWAECVNPTNAYISDAWEIHQLLSVPNPQTLHLADLEGNLLPELLTSVRGEIDRFFWLQRPDEGEESWKPQPVADWPRPGPAALGDLNGNGQGFDLVSQLKEGEEPPTLGWSQFNGNGWDERTLIAEEIPPLNSLTLVNLDDDTEMEIVATTANKKGVGVLFLIDKTETGWESHVLAKGLGFPGQLMPIHLEEGKPPLILSFLGPFGEKELSNGVYLWEITRVTPDTAAADGSMETLLETVSSE